MKIDIKMYTNSEIQIIIDKINNLSINYSITLTEIKILDDIDMKTYNYLIDFNK